MRKLIYLMALLLAAGMLSCKTNEKNYRQAYERTMARDSARVDFDQTVYGQYRRQERQERVVSAGDTAQVTVRRVNVTPDQGVAESDMQKYNIVVAGFKQLLNAKSMRDRIKDGGYQSAFVVQTPEPYYYVVAATSASLADAQQILQQLRAQSPVAMRSPNPYILVPTQLRNRP